MNPMTAVRAILSILLIGSNAFAFRYGLSEGNTAAVESEKQRTAMAATVAIVDRSMFVPKLSMLRMNQAYKTCEPDAQFESQELVATCSGTLIGEDQILTAGHCFYNPHEMCKKSLDIFFDFDNQNRFQDLVTSGKNHYKCVKVLAFNYTLNSKIPRPDYIVIQLDRKVKDRQPVQIGNTGPQNIAAKNKLGPVFALGHPLGLPRKIVTGYIDKNDYNLNLSNLVLKKSYLSVHLLAPNGLSGGGVYDASWNFLGVLVRGASALESDNAGAGRCIRFQECSEDQCTWAHVETLSNLKK